MESTHKASMLPNTEWWFSFPRKSTWVMELWAELAGFFSFFFFSWNTVLLERMTNYGDFFKVEFFVSFNIADKIVRHLKCKMWSFDMCIHCERILLSPSHHVFLFIVRTFTFCFLHSLQLYNTVLSVLVTIYSHFLKGHRKK